MTLLQANFLLVSPSSKNPKDSSSLLTSASVRSWTMTFFLQSSLIYRYFGTLSLLSRSMMFSLYI